MDSLTQLVLGAAVGEVVAGKKLGNKAMLWGAIAGTIPDLDIIANFWMDMVDAISFHRSVTHSFLFAFIVSPVLGYILWRYYKKEMATYTQWTMLFFFGFVTHSILDSFTTWGTQLFWPFSNTGIAFYNVFVVDPFYTVPFLVCLIAAAFYNRKSRTRAILNYTGLAISSAYIVFTFYAKSKANQAFETSLQEQEIRYTSYISKPTPLNAILWAVTVETEDGFYTGFYSLLDEDKQIEYDFEPKQWNLLQDLRGDEKLERLLELTKGYYTVYTENGDDFYINDLRFGKYDGWREEGGHYVFVYRVKKAGDWLQFEELNVRPKPDATYFKSFLNRVLGK